ncbi:MAG: hypothetical protein CMJ46_12660 [Planctomyces sp.]|nr:hypothetical protein [Planctomyces sp.]
MSGEFLIPVFAEGEPFGLGALATVVAVILLVVVAWYYIILPLIVRPTLKFKKDPTIAPFDPDELVEPLLPALEVFAHQHESLRGLGFEFLTNFFISDATLSGRTIGEYWFHNEFRTICAVSYVYVVQNNAIVAPSMLISFATRFSNDTLIVTNNASDPGLFPEEPKAYTYSMSWEESVEKLNQFHQAACAQIVPATRSNRLDNEFSGDVFEAHKAGIRASNEYSVDVGYLRPEPGDYYVATIRGAYLMTWKLLRPFKQIRLWMMKVKVRRKMTELGLHDF